MVLLERCQSLENTKKQEETRYLLRDLASHTCTRARCTKVAAGNPPDCEWPQLPWYKWPEKYHLLIDCPINQVQLYILVCASLAVAYYS